MDYWRVQYSSQFEKNIPMRMSVKMSWWYELIINVHVCECLLGCVPAWQCACCARVLFSTALCWTSIVAAAKAHWAFTKTHSTSWPVCVHTITTLLHKPSCQNSSMLFQTISLHIFNTVPSTRGHTLNQVTAARLSLTQKGHVNLSLQAVQTWVSCRFHRNDGCYF